AATSTAATLNSRQTTQQQHHHHSRTDRQHNGDGSNINISHRATRPTASGAEDIITQRPQRAPPFLRSEIHLPVPVPGPISTPLP
ncbi:hypothetical protein M5D96_009051, partial [Drosophila gunungcola]